MTAETPGGLRVVSLVPSVTETLLDWGIVPVAVTRFCEQPHLRAVGGTKNPDREAIVDLHPDVVVMDREENRAEDAAALVDAGLEVLALHVRAVSDVARALKQLAAAVGHPGPVEPDPGLAGALPAVRMRAWVPIWRRPWMSINSRTYGSSMLAAAGIGNVFGDHADAYPRATLDQVRDCQPDVVLAPSEPYAFGPRHRPELESVAPVIFVDGKDLFWWGSRTPLALERLKAAGRRWAVDMTGREVRPSS